MSCQLEFDEPPRQTKAPRVTNLSAKEAQIASAEVQKLLDKGIITKTTHDVDEFIQLFLLGLNEMGLIVSS